MRINHNIAALQSFHAVRNANRSTEASMTRLTTGYKINSAKDDASGLAISNKMKLQITGLEKASQNAMDGVSMVQTADGALSEVHNMLQRMRELAVKASTSTLEDADRAKIQDEIDSLLDEINDISMRTEFNGIKLFGPKARGGDGFAFFNAGSTLAGTPIGMLKGADTTEGFPDGDFELSLLNISGNTNQLSFSLDFPLLVSPTTTGFIRIGGTAITVTNSINDTIANLQAFADSKGYLFDISSTSPYVVDIYSPLGAGYVDMAGSGNIEHTNFTSAESISPSYKIDPASVKFTTSEGFNIPIESVSIDYLTNEITITLDKPYKGMQAVMEADLRLDTDGVYRLYDSSVSPPVPAPLERTSLDATYRDYSDIILQTGPSKDMEVNLDIPQINSHTLGLDNIAYITISDAGSAITICDRAIASVSLERSKLGAYQNRLEYAATSLDGTQDNMKQALSRIMDTDMAKEMTYYTQHNIISQAGLSILAQANQRPQQILQLIGQ